jgi:uncharacterized membrane protein YhaH (DUF805 family)
MAKYETPVTVRGLRNSVVDTLVRTFDFTGRSRRFDVVAFIVASQLAGGIASMMLGDLAAWDSRVISRLLIDFVVLLPFFALFARRCHDQGRSGWWTLILLPLAAANAYSSVRVSFHAFDPLWPDLGWWNLPLLLLAVTMLAFSFWPPAEGNRFGPDPRIEPEPITN